MAEKLGMTVNELLSRITSEELSEWMAYYELEAEDQKQRELDMRCQQNMAQRKGR